MVVRLSEKRVSRRNTPYAELKLFPLNSVITSKNFLVRQIKPAVF